tara:strand:+ start:672 stop:1010 length:339 start_codon:yes stop_codon:yes gene_type:complete
MYGTFFLGKSFFYFLLDLIDARKYPNLENLFNIWCGYYLPESFHEYDQNDCAEYYLKQKKYIWERERLSNITRHKKLNVFLQNCFLETTEMLKDKLELEYTVSPVKIPWLNV